MEPLIVHCGKCGYERTIGHAPISLDVFAAIGKLPCGSCGSKKVFMGPLPKPTADGDAHGWLRNGDTGISSKTIWRVLMDIVPPHLPHVDVPQDPDDFGRCYRLLKVMPSWRDRLGEVAERYAAWKPLVSVWDELTALYEEELPNGTAPKLYKRMQELIGVDV